METEVDDVIKQVQQQVIMENFKALVQSLSPKCFNLCVPKPGLKLSSSEEDCLDRCVKTYTAAAAVTSNVFLKRVKDAQQQMSS
jgi:import inner membrane translocase subunit TIM13